MNAIVTWLLPFRVLAGYSVWVFAVKMVVLTVMTYFLIPSGSSLQAISEAFDSNSVPIAGFSALLFVVFLALIYPLSTTRFDDFLDRKIIWDSFFPSFLRGSVIAVGLLGAMLLTGYYHFLGVFVNFEEALPVFLFVSVRCTAIVLLVYFEEYLFRGKIFGALIKKMHPLYAACLAGIAYCIAKMVQFDLTPFDGLMHLTTLFLVSVFLALTVYGSTFAKGAGLWSSMLIVFHAISGLPVFGSDFAGVFLFEYNSAPTAGDWIPGGGQADSRLALFLTGGRGGPLSSFAFQLLLMIGIGFRLLKFRQTR